MVIRTGLYLALLLSFIFALLYYLLIDTVLAGLSLAPAVSSIAKTTCSHLWAHFF